MQVKKWNLFIPLVVRKLNWHYKISNQQAVRTPPATNITLLRLNRFHRIDHCRFDTLKTNGQQCCGHRQ
jgi:hypothetical protein